MPAYQHQETDQLLRQLADGDAAAREQLLRLHRERLTQMVAMRVDPRVKGRFDPSDVVQEALVIADQRLSGYAKVGEVAFYPWLRKIAWEQLLKFHERHFEAQKRSVAREQRTAPRINDESVDLLLDRLAAAEGSPSENVIRMERRNRVLNALEELKPRDREIIELRYLEHLDNSEIAAVLNVSQAVVRTRHFRAIQRLHRALRGPDQA